MLFYWMADLKGSKKLILELSVPLYFNVFAIQPDLLARSIASALDSFIMGSFMQFLYMR